MFASSYTYRTFDKLRRVDQAAVVENERLGAVLAHIRDRQAGRRQPYTAVEHPQADEAA